VSNVFNRPVLLIFGKSVVNSSVTGDIFEGIADGRSAFTPVHGYRETARDGLSVELGGPWISTAIFEKRTELIIWQHDCRLPRWPSVPASAFTYRSSFTMEPQNSAR